MHDDWITEILELGIGEVAEKYLYLMGEGAILSPICPHCYYKVRKFAFRCPICRRELPWVKGIEISE